MQVPNVDWSKLDAKVEQLRALAVDAGCQKLVLKQQATLSWLLGARSHVPSTLDATCFDVCLDVPTGELTVVVNAIEAPRLRATELRELPARFEILPWWHNRADVLPSGESVGSDSQLPDRRDLTTQVALIRRTLDSEQQLDLRNVCRETAAAATRAAQQLTPAMTEYQAAAVVASELLADALDPIVLMVSGAERMARDRHPIPTTAPLGDRAMLVCCARRYGLVASVTRIVSFCSLTNAERDGYRRLLAVESCFLDATLPGRTLAEVLHTGTQAYDALGFDANEWHRHHQGGYSGWEPREFPARPTSPDVLAPNQCVAWNPSGGGWKVEDTCLITETGAEPLVDDGAWPTLTVAGRRRPDVLEAS